MKKIILIFLFLLISSTVHSGMILSGIMGSSQICTVPTQPVVTATAGNGKVTLALTSGGTGATSFTINRGTSSNGETQVHTGVSMPYTDDNSGAGLTAGTTYYFTVVAVSNCGSSNASSEVSATPTTIWTNNVGKWALANTTYTDASSSGNNLTASGSPTAAIGHGGTSAAATNFNNSPYLYHADNASLSITGNFSFSIWVYPTAVNVNQDILSKWNTSQASYYIYVDNSNNLIFYLSNSSAVFAYVYPPITVNTWYHIAGTYDGGYLRIYVNGVLVNNGSNNPLAYSGGIKDSTAQFQLGHSQNSSRPWNGRLDDAALWARTLSDAEISELYNAGDDFSGLH